MSPRLRRLGVAATAFALGAAQTHAYVHTAWWPLPIVTLALLWWRVDRETPRRAAFLGWAYGCGWLCAGVWWLYVSLHRYGGLPAALAVAAVAALAAALSLYLAAACGLYARWRRGSAGDVPLFAALWLLAELARGVWFTGFPWLASGYSQVDSPLAVLAPWAGVYAIGAVLAAAAASLVLLVARRRWVPAVATAALVALVAALPSERTQPAGELSVALLQTNVAQDVKFTPERMPQTLEWVARQLAAAHADLVVTPETAVPLLPSQLDDFVPGYWPGLRALFDRPGRAALVGIPLGDLDRGIYTNSVLGLAPGVDYRYDKSHLVPFGEFIPNGFHWFTAMMDIPLGDFARGVDRPPSFAVGRQRVAPNVCYEDLFGEELARRFADPQTAPTVLANVSNIGWFGDTAAIPQHLQISRMRTLELQRPMLRATNTGATAVVDHRGRVVAALPPFTEGVLHATVQGRTGTTPYAAWAGRFGSWPLWIAALAVASALAPAAEKGRRRAAAVSRAADGA